MSFDAFTTVQSTSPRQPHTCFCCRHVLAAPVERRGHQIVPEHVLQSPGRACDVVEERYATY